MGSASDYQGMNERLCAASAAVLREWLPNGRRSGNHWHVGGLDGAAGRSLQIDMRTGQWIDQATGECGHDLVALYGRLHGLANGAALAKLSGEAPEWLPKRGKPVRLAVEKKPVAVMPVPADAPAPDFRHGSLGMPVAAWVYRSAQGLVNFHVARYETPDGGKACLPWIWTGSKWEPRAPQEPRPLFGLDRLGLAAPVLICEGEKATSAAQAIVNERFACIGWQGGAEAWPKSDWTAIAGRTCILWPDADAPGRRCMEALAGHLVGLGCPVRVLEISDMPDGWDAADAFMTWRELSTFIKERARTWHTRAADILPEPAPPPESTPALGAEILDPLPATTPSAPPKPREAEPSFGSWEKLGLKLSDKGAVINNLDNTTRVLLKDPELAGRIWYDEFLDQVLTDWNGPSREWRDVDDVRLALYMQRAIGMNTLTPKVAKDAALVAAMHQKRNECRDWLDALVWDRVPRLGGMLEVAFGAAGSDYTQSVGQNWMISMVARVYSPGCQVDSMVVLEGGQGTYKSSALATIGGRWFSECHEDVLSKDFFGVLRGKILVEIAELHAFGRAKVERIKGIITCRADRYRKAYGTHTETHPRICVLAGTTNRDDWHRDDTGGRRFWPVLCGTIDIGWLRKHRDQLWAEAVHQYREGAAWWIIDKFEQEAQISARREVDAWEEPVARWLGRSVQASFTPTEILDGIEIDRARQDKGAVIRVNAIMRCLGYGQKFMQRDGRMVRAWIRNV